MFVSRTRLLEILSSRDYINFGNISTVDWSNALAECEKNVELHPEYWCSLVADSNNSWDNIGDEYFESIKHYADWGYTSENTRSWETTSVQPQLHMDWEQAVINSLPLSHAISRPTLQQPGNVMPWHWDRFYNFKRQFPQSADYIVRFIVFINDWTPGQFLQAGNSVISNWQAGDIRLWYPNRMHLAANAGYANKWTTNITGILDENIEIPYTIAKDILGTP